MLIGDALAHLGKIYSKENYIYTHIYFIYSKKTGTGDKCPSHYTIDAAGIQLSVSKLRIISDDIFLATDTFLWEYFIKILNNILMMNHFI